MANAIIRKENEQADFRARMRDKQYAARVEECARIAVDMLKLPVKVSFYQSYAIRAIRMKVNPGDVVIAMRKIRDADLKDKQM